MMFADKLSMFLSMLNPGALANLLEINRLDGRIFSYFHPFRLLSYGLYCKYF